MAVAATFTAEPLLQPLELVLTELGLRPRVHLAPYHQVLHQLLSPSSLLSTHVGAANVVLVRLEDFVREVLEPDDALSLVDRVWRELSAALLHFARRSRAGLLVLLLPVSSLRPEPLGQALQAATTRLRQQLEACRSLHLVDPGDIAARCGADSHDRLRDELAHIPYTEDYFAAIALVLANHIRALQKPGEPMPALPLTTGSAVLESLRQRQRRRRPLRTRAVQPASTTERELLTLWQELLKIEKLGVEDNFFALGGDSVLAARLIAGIAHQFGVRLAPGSLDAAPTVRLLAHSLHAEQAAQGIWGVASLLVELKAGGPLNLFLVHDADGQTLPYQRLAQQLPGALSVYGIEPHRLPGVPLAASSIPQMAGDYVAQVRRLQPHGPYRLGGVHAGGVIAYEMARQLQALGEPVAIVALLDTARPGAPWRQAPPARSPMRRLWVNLRFALLRRRLARPRPWLARLPALSACEIYDRAEARYEPQPLHGAGVVLLRARGRQADADETLGWRAVVPDLQLQQVEGDDAGLLQEPAVITLAAALAERLLPKAERESDRTRAPLRPA